MIGPTGVGKTEIARRLAKLAQAPFVKVEASKFTEVGYVGRDVDTMIRDLVENAIQMVREEAKERVLTQACAHAEERLLDLLLPRPRYEQPKECSHDQSREKLRQMLRDGALADRELELDAEESAKAPLMQVFSAPGVEEMSQQLQDMLGPLLGKR